MLNMGRTTVELERIYLHLNHYYFKNELPDVQITVQSSGKRPALGWCTRDKRWRGNGKQECREINISAEYLDRKDKAIVTTLLHEMVHLYCAENGIKDTSRSGTYHNEKYKTAAEAHGLNITKNEKYGWHDSTLADPGIMDKLKVNRQAFTVARQAAQPKSGGTKSSSRKYVCPACATTVRATKEVSIICGDCQELMTTA
jgi:hypothetical protein